MMKVIANGKTSFFDKTGTITKGKLEATAFMAMGGISEADLLLYESSREAALEHPH